MSGSSKKAGNDKLLNTAVTKKYPFNAYAEKVVQTCHDKRNKWHDEKKNRSEYRFYGIKHNPNIDIMMLRLE